MKHKCRLEFQIYHWGESLFAIGLELGNECLCPLQQDILVDCAIKWMQLYLYDFVRGKAGEILLSKLHCYLLQSNPTQIHSHSPKKF